MKKMYLEVDVEQNHGNWVDVYYRNGMCFTCHKDDEELVEIEDAENKGAEKMCKAITNICNSDDGLVESAFDGYCTYASIISKFTPKEIIQRAEKLNVHVPTTGDVYQANISGKKVIVMSYDKEKKNVLLMSNTCFMFITLNTLNEFYSFTGCNHNEFSSILNELEGNNT